MSVSRPQALLVLLAACGEHATHPADAPAATDGAIDTARADGLAGTRVRLMAANLTSGTQQAYEDPGIRIFQGLVPDVIMIQEFDYKAGDLRSLVDTAFGTTFDFYVEPRVGGIPNGIVSRYPILDSGVWTDASTTDRAFAFARIDIPGPIDLWAVSVHLLTTSAAARATEAQQLLGYITSTVPAGDYLFVGGDFNTDATNEQALVELSTIVDIAPPWPADQTGNTNTSINRNHPHDWLLASPNVETSATPLAIGATTFPAGLVFDSRVYTPLADVAPVLATDSAAPGMQHMPVLKDFAFGP